MMEIYCLSCKKILEVKTLKEKLLRIINHI